MFSRLFGGFGASVQPGSDKVQVKDPVTVRVWWEAGDVVLVDVRERNEYAAEFIPGSVNIPLSSFDPTLVPKPAAGKHLVIHCRSGMRCGMAANRLLASGWDGDIVRMQGGIIGWKSSGGPTRRGS
jgi:rhodanese-related sulfurtransferase